jgi:hypothetical protein
VGQNFFIHTLVGKTWLLRIRSKTTLTDGHILLVLLPYQHRRKEIPELTGGRRMRVMTNFFYSFSILGALVFCRVVFLVFNIFAL